MTRRLRIEWCPGQKVTGRLEVPARQGGVGVLLAHGAGGGQDHPFMAGLRRRLAGSGLLTLSFDYPYMEAGRRAPDRLETLERCHRAALARLRRYVDGAVLAGKSMGGRVAGHLAANGEPCRGLVFYGYPLVAPGKVAPRSVAHLAGTGARMLFVSGSRDRLAPLDLLRPSLAALPGATLRVIPGADHSFRLAKRSGKTLDDVLDELVDTTRAWMRTGG